MKSTFASRSGSALVITLSLLVALTLLVVGMTMLMRTEQKGAAMLDREMASRQLAQIGWMNVIATLRDTIPTTLDNNRYYASMPGMVVGVDNSSAPSIVKIGLLYSNGTKVSVVNSTSLTAGVSLSNWMTVTPDKMFNINHHDIGMRAPIIPLNDFYTLSSVSSLASGPNIAAIQVGWRYVTAPSADGTMVIGRFAYWTDDEATRININSAWRRSVPSSTTVIDTSSIDVRSPGTLGAIEGIAPAGSIADNIRNYRNWPVSTFHTLDQLKFVNGMTSDIYERNKFYFTNYGTPNFGSLSTGGLSITLAGVGSIHFGGGAGTAAVPNYGTYTFYRGVGVIGSTAFGVYRVGTETEVDVFHRPKLNYNTLTVTGFGATMNPELYARLSSTASVSTTTSFTPAGTWSRVFPGITKDFLSKYPMTETSGQNATSVIGNASGFQLMANMIEFTRGSNTNAVSAPLAATGTHEGLPVLNNQLGYLGLKRTPHLNEVIGNGTSTTEFDGSEYTSRYSWRVQIEVINPYNVTFNNCQIFYRISYAAFDSIAASLYPNPGTLTATLTANIPPGYSILEIGMQNADELVGPDPVYATDIYIKVHQLRLMNENGYLRDYLALKHFNALFTHVRGMQIAMNTAGIFDSDPATYNADNQTEDPSRANSLGKDDPRVPNIWNRGGSGTPNAQNNGLTWNNGSKDSSESGVALTHSTFFHKELPLTSLGELGYIHTGIPWRTLRMQPRSNHSSETDAIPDWALWDIFKLVDDYKSITPVTGKINVNQRIIHASSDSPPQRLAPAFALLGDIGGIFQIANNNTGSLAAAIVAGATNFTQTGTFGPSPFGGAILEVASITNNATTDAGAEHIARLIAPLVTARSRRFTVWSVGQTIIDVNRNGFYDIGIDIISGESRLQTTIERDPITNVYRVLYQRPFSE